ncbi:hypothetical protein FB451DRAFT_1169126 [Mycena latifolia]|nr:hypothetical protein FB451DRAFT_1169126 [Mycena latifolia]
MAVYINRLFWSVGRLCLRCFNPRHYHPEGASHAIKSEPPGCIASRSGCRLYEAQSYAPLAVCELFLGAVVHGALWIQNHLVDSFSLSTSWKIIKFLLVALKPAHPRPAGDSSVAVVACLCVIVLSPLPNILGIHHHKLLRRLLKLRVLVDRVRLCRLDVYEYTNVATSWLRDIQGGYKKQSLAKQLRTVKALQVRHDGVAAGGGAHRRGEKSVIRRLRVPAEPTEVTEYTPIEEVFNRSGHPKTIGLESSSARARGGLETTIAPKIYQRLGGGVRIRRIIRVAGDKDKEL